jgi:hypothetical protein
MTGSFSLSGARFSLVIHACRLVPPLGQAAARLTSRSAVTAAPEPHADVNGTSGQQPPANTQLRMAASRRAFVRAWSQYVPVIESARFDSHASSGVRAQAVGYDGTLLDDFVISQTPWRRTSGTPCPPAAASSLALARELVDRFQTSAMLKRGARFSIEIAHLLCNDVIIRRGWVVRGDSLRYRRS